MKISIFSPGENTSAGAFVRWSEGLNIPCMAGMRNEKEGTAPETMYLENFV